MFDHTHHPIFSKFAPSYYAVGLPVIPLHKREKKPIPFDWSRFHDTEVELATRCGWLVSHTEANMGLVLGKQSGLIMIDIDTEDDVLKDKIMAILPYSPWHRFGKKGMMLAFKWTPIKTHRIKNVSGQTIVECLSSKTQCVLPPSIHPETLKEYVANANLWEVLGQLQELPPNIEEILRDTISKHGVPLSHSGWSRVTDHISKGSRDTTLTEIAGLFAYAVVRGERTLKEAIGMLHSYYSEFVDTTDGEMDVDKHIGNLVKFIHRDVLDKKKVLPKGWDDGYTKEQLMELGVTLGEDETEWDFEKIVEYLQDEFQKYPDGVKRSEAVERIMLRLSNSHSITTIEEDRILKYVMDVGGFGVPIGTFKKRLRELRMGDIKGTDQTELAKALLKDLEMINIVRFHAERFYKWNGSHWVVMQEQPLLAKISANYGHLEACKRVGDMKGVLRLMSIIMTNGLQTREVRGINFANGFLTLEMKLIPHDPEYGMTYTLPFRYMPEEAGKFPLFAEFMATSWGRDKDCAEKIAALQEAICVVMFGLGSQFQRAILFHGAPQSGKTQLLNILQSLVPEEAKCSVLPEDWSDKFMPAMMAGKILNVCGELSDKKYIDGQKFKDIIDGSQQSAQHKHGQIFTFNPTLTHIFASNHIPKSHDTSFGFIRRWLMLTFHYPVADKDKKLNLGINIVAEEREAIVAWAVQALPRLMSNNTYTLPSSHVTLQNEFANLNNSVRYFLKESGKVRLNVIDGHVQEMQLFNSYWGFCLTAGGTKPVSSMKFRAMMRELGGELGFTTEISEGGIGSSSALFRGLNLVL